jgi:hypothetical protein
MMVRVVYRMLVQADEKAIERNGSPGDVEQCRRISSVMVGIDEYADATEEVEQQVNLRVKLQPVRGYAGVGQKHKYRSDPTDNIDQ